jgi:lipopolysaccharide export LptBFGC system permease protein LptF
MSYKNRKELRKNAEWILEILCGNGLREVNALGNDFEKYSFDTFTTRQLMAIMPYTLDEMNGAIRLLLENKHIVSSTILTDPLDKLLHATILGQDAFDTGYYEKENKKDRAESVELYSRWILPIISTLTSLLALALSIYNTYHFAKH